MRQPPTRSRRLPPVPLTPVVVPMAGGLGVELDFGQLFAEAELADLLRELGVEWSGITGAPTPPLRPL